MKKNNNKMNRFKKINKMIIIPKNKLLIKMNKKRKFRIKNKIQMKRILKINQNKIKNKKKILLLKNKNKRM